MAAILPNFDSLIFYNYSISIICWLNLIKSLGNSSHSLSLSSSLLIHSLFIHSDFMYLFTSVYSVHCNVICSHSKKQLSVDSQIIKEGYHNGKKITSISTLVSHSIKPSPSLLQLSSSTSFSYYTQLIALINAIIRLKTIFIILAQ